jgi:hypothetical protein
MADQDGMEIAVNEPDPAQQERTERACAAIRAGQFQITRAGSLQWTVQNGDRRPYVVSLHTGAWACTCPDFDQRGPDLRCKHIEGVRLSEAAQQNRFEKEKQMEQTPPEKLEPGERVLWELRQPLDMARVKRRQAPGQGTVPYLEGHEMIERANAIFDFAWSFDLLGEPEIVRWQKKVMLWNQQERRKVPQLDADGNAQVEEVGIVYITGKVCVTLKDQVITHADLGRCIFSGDTPEALDMALAGAVTDCLKRCFRQMGDQFGNALYDKEIAQSAGQAGNPAAAQRRPATTPPPATPVRQYSDGTSVNGNVPEQEAYDAFLKKVGKAPATKNDLRTWIATNRAPAAA